VEGGATQTIAYIIWCKTVADALKINVSNTKNLSASGGFVPDNFLVRRRSSAMLASLLYPSAMQLQNSRCRYQNHAGPSILSIIHDGPVADPEVLAIGGANY